MTDQCYQDPLCFAQNACYAATKAVWAVHAALVEACTQDVLGSVVLDVWLAPVPCEKHRPQDVHSKMQL